MYETEPAVFLIARPQLDWKNIESYLNVVGGGANEWTDRMLTQAGLDPISGEALVEFAGRLCYRSFKEGLNPNVTRVRKDSTDYMLNILKSKHGSVLEHAQYSFVFHNVSRVFTHELVRHRVGVGISQESLRYVRLQHLGFRIPEILSPLHKEVVEVVEHLENFQMRAAEFFELDNPELKFHIKKEITSALRRLAPIGLSTGMVWSANLRTLRFCCEARTLEGAEEEIRLVFGKVAEIMKQECPSVFQDFEKQEDGTWMPQYSKV